MLERGRARVLEQLPIFLRQEIEGVLHTDLEHRDSSCGANVSRRAGGATYCCGFGLWRPGERARINTNGDVCFFACGVLAMIILAAGIDMPMCGLCRPVCA